MTRSDEIPLVACRDLGVQVRGDLETCGARGVVALAEHDIALLDDSEAVVQRADLLVDFPEEAAFVQRPCKTTGDRPFCLVVSFTR